MTNDFSENFPDFLWSSQWIMNPQGGIYENSLTEFRFLEWIRTDSHGIKELVRFRRHDEIVLMQSADFMGPPTHLYLSPL